MLRTCMSQEPIPAAQRGAGGEIIEIAIVAVMRRLSVQTPRARVRVRYVGLDRHRAARINVYARSWRHMLPLISSKLTSDYVTDCLKTPEWFI